MNWFIGIVAYVVIWWIVIFAVLPFGVSLSDEGDPGHAARRARRSAPQAQGGGDDASLPRRSGSCSIGQCGMAS